MGKCGDMKNFAVFVFCLFVGGRLLAVDRPNVILVMADDLGWGDVGFNGNMVIKTPHLDAMAADGMKLTRFYSAAPVCSPTRGSVLTGRHPFRYGIYNANTGHMKPGEVTLAELMRDGLGYRTGHFGKWHLGTLTKTMKDANRGGKKGAKNYSVPAGNGFDVNFSTESKVPTFDPLIIPKKPSGSRKDWWDPAKEGEETEHYGTHYWNEKGEEVTENTRGDDSRVVMDRAIPFIRDAVEKKSPFFSVIWFHAPHLPVVAGPEHTGLYPDVKDGYTKHYYGCISALDEQVGRLRAELRVLGIEQNTLLCFCSDNGPEGNEGKAPGSSGGFRGRKRSLYEGGVRVPGLIEWPAMIKPGTVTDFPAVTSDYLPTILEALGVKYPGERPLDGMSLMPMIRGEIAVRPRPIGFQSGGVQTLNDQRFKLVRAKKSVELYDLIDDPYETKDLSKKEGVIVKQMTEKLDHWVASCKISDVESDYTMSTEKPLFEFGVIADCQYADAPTPKQMPQRFYRLAKDKLVEAVDHLNTEDLAFTIHLGDFIDKNFVSFDVVGPIYDRLKAPRYHLLGNHDYSVSDEEKAKVVERLGMPARYYEFKDKGWRFIVLDGNEISTLAYPEGSERWKAGEAYRQKFKSPPPNWSGGIGAEQIAWLEARLEEAKAAGEPVIVFCHYPVFPKGVHNLWNDDELLAVISKYKDTVAAWMNGHNHDGNFGEKDGVPYVNFKGMLDTRLNAYAVVSVFPDGTLKITGYGREPDRLLIKASK